MQDRFIKYFIFPLTMEENKYLIDRSRCEEIGRGLKKRYKQTFSSRSDAGEKFAELTHLSENTADKLITLYTSGLFAYKCSSTSSSSKQLIHLERLVIFYKLLNIPENDLLVEIANEVNPNFLPLYQKEKDTLKIKNL